MKATSTALRWSRRGFWTAAVGTATWLWAHEPSRSALPPGVHCQRNWIYRQRQDGGEAALDLYWPDEAFSGVKAPAKGWPVVLALHGGGWRGGGKGDYGRQAAWLAQEGYVVAAADYALSRPSQPSWPINVEDVREAVRWLKRNAYSDRLPCRIDADRIAALGASAGGHLAAWLGVLPRDDESRPRAVVSFYGPMDLVEHYEVAPQVRATLGLFLGGSPSQRPDAYRAASPLPRVSDESAPMLLIHGRDDLIVPCEQSQRMAERLRAAAVTCRLRIVEHARHGFGFQYGPYDFRAGVLDFLTRVWQHNL